jgi:nitroimidazol reductase NimA-like FMN-containing flavoprotein (pyridoxamine 5'-phosphate oxidase superfamily)
MNSRNLAQRNEMNAIVDQCEVCYVGMVDGDSPYVLPFNFAIEGDFLYLHSGPGGKKERILKNNNKVCVAFSTAYEMYRQNEEVACSWGMKFKSVLIYGKVDFIEANDKKIEILNKIMKKYSGRDDFKYNDPAINNVVIYKIEIEEITGKARGY